MIAVVKLVLEHGTPSHVQLGIETWKRNVSTAIKLQIWPIQLIYLIPAKSIQLLTFYMPNIIATSSHKNLMINIYIYISTENFICDYAELCYIQVLKYYVIMELNICSM